MAKVKCTFNASLRNEYQFLKLASAGDLTVVLCTLCSGKFSIASRGRASILDHLKTAKHCKSSQQVSSNKSMDSYIRDSNDPVTMKLQAIELAFAYHTGKHRQSLRTSECTARLVREFFNSKFKCGRTKTSKLINKVRDICVFLIRILIIPFFFCFRSFHLRLIAVFLSCLTR